MSHEIESMFFKGETPWHGLGTEVHGVLTSLEAIEKAGLDWKVNLVPLYTAEDELVAERRAVQRDSDRRILGTVGTGYHALQNKDAFGFFDSFVNVKEATYETAGSLAGGRKVWVLAKLNRAPIEVVNGDVVQKFLLLSNSHDGTTSVKVGFTPIRVVCANTLAMAHGAQSQLLRVRHTARVKESVDQIIDIVNSADAQFEATAEKYKRLSRKGVNEADLKKYVKEVFYPRMLKEDMSDRMVMRMERIEKSILRLFEVGRGAEITGVRGTAWGAYNAVNEFLTYEKPGEQDAKLDSLWFGHTANVNQRAFEMAMAF